MRLLGIILGLCALIRLLRRSPAVVFRFAKNEYWDISPTSFGKKGGPPSFEIRRWTEAGHRLAALSLDDNDLCIVESTSNEEDPSVAIERLSERIVDAYKH